MANNHSADRELDALLRNMRARGFLVGIDELTPALRANLVELKQGRDIGLRDPDGEPVRSLRGFAQLMGNESAYSYLLQIRERERDALHHHPEPDRKYHEYPVCSHEFR